MEVKLPPAGGCSIYTRVRALLHVHVSMSMSMSVYIVLGVWGLFAFRCALDLLCDLVLVAVASMWHPEIVHGSVWYALYNDSRDGYTRPASRDCHRTDARGSD